MGDDFAPIAQEGERSEGKRAVWLTASARVSTASSTAVQGAGRAHGARLYALRLRLLWLNTNHGGERQWLRR